MKKRTQYIHSEPANQQFLLYPDLYCPKCSARVRAKGDWQHPTWTCPKCGTSRTGKDKRWK